MDGRRGDAEEALHVAFGRRATVEQAVGPDEGKILPCISVKRVGAGGYPSSNWFVFRPIFTDNRY
jgi:hypothetical protein